jgi:hypothetical protein
MVKRFHIKNSLNPDEVFEKIDKESIRGGVGTNIFENKICIHCHDEEKSVVSRGLCYDCYVAWLLK